MVVKGVVPEKYLAAQLKRMKAVVRDCRIELAAHQLKLEALELKIRTQKSKIASAIRLKSKRKVNRG
jgi:hypothetical protein